MAMHEIRRYVGRHRARIALRTRLRRAWRSFWWEPPREPQHATGATERFAVTLRNIRKDIDITKTIRTAPVLEVPTEFGTDNPGHYRLLMDAPVICGTGLEHVEGHVLVGNPYERNGGTV